MNARKLIKPVAALGLAAATLAGAVLAQEAQQPAAPPPPPKPQINAAQSLQELLEQTRNARAAEAQQNAAREQQFLADRNKQASLLATARAERNAQENRSKVLSAQFEANEKKLTEISDVQDHSDRNGMRLVIELKRDSNPKVVLNKLYKHTPLQSTFGVNMVALVENVPRLLPLKEVIRNVHVKDARPYDAVRDASYPGRVVEDVHRGRFLFVPAGEGVTDNATVLATLANDGYAGPVTVEAHTPPDTLDAVFAQGLRFCRERGR